jgi:hypothetical protein
VNQSNDYIRAVNLELLANLCTVKCGILKILHRCIFLAQHHSN